MDQTGTKQSTKGKAITYRRQKELQAIVDDFASAMLSAHLPYIAESGRMTPSMESAWGRYVWFAQENA